MRKHSFLVFLLIIAMMMSFLTVFADETPSGIDVERSGGNIILRPGEYPSLSVDNEGIAEESIKAINVYKRIGTAILSIGTITMALFFVKQIYSLGKAGDNAKEREEAVKGILITGIATALLGGLDTIAIVFMGFLR